MEELNHFKYKAEIIANVREANIRKSLRDYGSIDKCVSYCFVNEDGEGNFTPYALKKPTVKRKLSGWALSFFKDKKQAIKKHHQLVRGQATQVRVLGTHLSEVEINEENGKASKPSSTTHFNILEYSENEFSGKERIIQSLLNSE